jgi:hypothetical protein
MRLFSTLLIVILTFSSLLGQYKSIFGSESTTWSMILYGICDATTTSKVEVIGDTVINGNNYNVISRYEMFSNNHGYLREDTTSGRIWFFNQDLNDELLVVDMSLAVSDTFEIIDYNKEKNKVFVDTVFYKNNLKHIRFLNAHIGICDGGGEARLDFIEGTGSNAGLFSNIHGFETSMISYLLCHEKNGVKVYGNTLFNDTCFVEIVGIPETTIEPLYKVYPNPSNKVLFIELLDDQILEFSLLIYNSFGEQLVSSNHVNSRSTSIDISNLEAGIFFIRINGSNHNNLGIKKFVKF